MKKQILRLSLGMAWCLSALVPVHAPAAGASATADHAARRDTRTAAAQTRPSPADTLHVVFFTDIHVTPGNAQDSLFRVAVAEANASDAELVIFGGDLTNTGSDEELEHVYGLMSQLEKPWFTVMGNHETTWSESGCTTFRCIFGHDGRVAYRAGGYLFLGYNCGPYMKMADGVVRTEDLPRPGGEAAAGTLADSHEQDEAYLRSCREAAREIVKDCGWTVIHCAKGDAPRTVEDIHNEVYKTVKSLL